MAVKVISVYLLPNGGWDLRAPIRLEFNDLSVEISEPPAGTDPRERIGATGTVTSELSDPAIESELDGLAATYDFSSLSKELRDASNHVAIAHSQAMRRVIDTLRWRLGAVGGHREIAGSKGTTWIDASGRTRPFPRRLTISTSSYALVAPDAAQRTEVERYLMLGKTEPVGHSLLREAREQTMTNPRSSLAIGVAALEIGVKEHIATMLPDARWLVSKAPTPPVVQMLASYVPSLPARRLVTKHPTAIDKRVKNSLQKAVEARNDLVHAGAASLADETLRSWLDDIEDCLYLLDYLRGELWATQRMSTKFRDEVGL